MQPEDLNEAPVHDLVLKNGRVIDPANKRDGRFDVAVKDGKIAAVEPVIDAGHASRVIDVADKLVAPGLIDTHAHIFQHVAGPFGLNPDQVGLRSGISTLLDQGGPSCMTIDGFRKFLVEPSETRVSCFLSTYLVGGLFGHIYSELYGPEQINVDATVKSVEANRDLVCGIKSHAEPGHYSRWGLEVLSKSKQIGRAVNLPVYVHLGTLWPVRNGAVVDPQALLREVVPLLDANDVMAHPFTRHPSGFTDAAGKGVTFDVGRGNHFSIEVAKAVLDAGVLPHTLGADLHGYNITKASSAQGAHLYAAATGTYQDGKKPDEGAALQSKDPAFSLHYAMSEMHALGIPIDYVIAMVTSNAAKMMSAADRLGTLDVGRTADIAVIDYQSGDFTMVDGAGATMKASHRFRPSITLNAGQPVSPSSDYLPFWEREAA
jgi:dihydroorotase